MTRIIFLLGGYDLEMIEIRNLLQEKGITYFDRQLSWDNALLQQYDDVLKEYGNKNYLKIYGIELRENSMRNIPLNYYRIDHHNDFSHKASSIAQVAEMLGIELSHYQKLVDANDSGYIPAMQRAGATQEEIESIRRKDRKIQGVTEEDEKLAKKAISERKLVDNMMLVKAYSSRFSPICDRLYPYHRLLIYNDDELMYYGEGKSRLVEKFAGEIEKGKMFHGGGDCGYFGAAKGVFSKEEIVRLKENIILFLIF